LPPIVPQSHWSLREVSHPSITIHTANSCSLNRQENSHKSSYLVPQFTQIHAFSPFVSIIFLTKYCHICRQVAGLWQITNTQSI
jgi:hypothetical protein